MKKNEVIKLNIERVSEGGDGIGYAPDGKVVFCAGALPGETAECLIIKTTERYCIGKLLSVDEESRSSSRVAPSCEVYSRCGGCVLGHVSYDYQLTIKESHVHDCIARIGGIGEYTRDAILASPEKTFYRNKSVYQFAPEKKTGALSCGFYRRNSHDIIDCSGCVISDSRAERVRTAFTELAVRFGISVYDEESGKGLLRRIMVRTSLFEGTAMVVIVINGRTLPNIDEILSGLLKECPFVSSVYINVNCDRNNTVMGKDFQLVYGAGYLADRIGGALFKISPQSFFQVNPGQTVRLYEKAFEYAGICGGESLLDLFCGIGTIGIYFAVRAREQGVSLARLTGIEYTPQAVEDAAANAALNGVSEISTFFAGDAEEVLGEIAGDVKKNAPDVIVVDPPRKGLTAPLIESVVSCRPKRVVYVSCNPATLARDLKQFKTLGYKTERVCPVDMFPMTEHVETVALLCREK